MSVTGGIMAGVGLAGSIGGAAISANAAGNAADTQANAAQQAAQLQYQASQNALDFQKQQWNQSQANMQPWLQSGGNALNQLNYMMGLSPYQSGGSFNQPTGATPPLPGSMPSPMLSTGKQPIAGSGGFSASTGTPTVPNAPTGSMPPVSGTPTTGTGPNTSLGGFGSLMQSYPGGPFVAPTALTEQNDPGYKARLQLGQDTMERSAAARGSLLTGGTAQAENQAAQDYASNEYGNVYNRAINSYGTNFNAFNMNQNNQYNRLASISGLGQTTAGQLGQLGQSTANNVSSNLLGTAANMGQQLGNAAAANASGIVGAANAYGGALSGTAGNLSNLMLLNQMYGGGYSNPQAVLGEAQNPSYGYTIQPTSY